MSVGPPVVGNAGPLMALYGRINFTRTVYDETVTVGTRQGHEDAGTLHRFLDEMEWRPVEVNSADIPTSLSQAPLDRGEKDTLALAANLGSPLVLMDETVGRQTARDLG